MELGDEIIHQIDHVNETRDQHEQEQYEGIQDNYAIKTSLDTKKITSNYWHKHTKWRRKLLMAAIVVNIPNIQTTIGREK